MGRRVYKIRLNPQPLVFRIDESDRHLAFCPSLIIEEKHRMACYASYLNPSVLFRRCQPLRSTSTSIT